MNARQKAKKYKRLYENLLKPPVKFTVENRNIVTWRCDKFYPAAPIVQSENDEYLREVILKDVTNDIAQEIANNFDKYVEHTMEFIPYLDAYCFRGEIKVVSKF